MKILVTGSAGFVGRHLVADLKAKGHEVFGMDRLIPKIGGLDMGSGWPGDGANGLYVQRFDDWHRYMPARLDQIYHLASPVGPVGILGLSGKIAEEIINGMFQIMYQAGIRGAKVLYTSTSEVYGPRDDDASLSEEMACVIPSHCTTRLEYGAAKLCGEIMATNYARVNEIDLKIVRLFNTIGEGQDAAKGFVVPRFMQQAQAGEPITVYGSGRQIRAFIDVRDVVEALQFVMEHGESASPYNVGNPNNTTPILDLAYAVQEVTGSRSRIEFVNPKDLHGPRFEEAWNKIPDINKICGLGWEPEYTLMATLRRLAGEKVPNAD